MADGMSVRDTLQAAIDDSKAEDPVAAVGEALAGRMPGDAPSTPAEGEAAPVAPDTDAQTAAPAADPNTAAAGAQERDEHGRFKPKAGQEGAQAAAPAAETAPTTETAKPPEEGPQTEATRIPASLPAAVKAQWGDLKPEVQQAFVKLEETVQTAKAEWGAKGQRLNRYDEILGPHVDKWRMSGLDEFSGVQTLLAAQNILESNPVHGLVHIARSYGVTPQQIAQALGMQMTGQPGSAEGQPAPTGAPDFSAALQPFMQRVQTLEQQLAQQSQASEASEMAKAHAEVETFRSDPKNLYFDNVREDVARRIQSGAAKTLAEAYDQAIWASPEVRPHLLAAQARDAQAAASARAAEDAKRAKAAEAARASGSVTGSPTPGAQPLTPGPALPLRDELAANLRNARAQV